MKLYVEFGNSGVARCTNPKCNATDWITNFQRENCRYCDSR